MSDSGASVRAFQEVPPTIPRPRLAPGQTAVVPTYDLNAAYAAFAALVPDADNVRNNDVTDTLYAIGYHNDNWLIWQQCVLATAS
jgi:hypothetical protein